MKLRLVDVCRDAYKNAGGWDQMPQHWKVGLVARALDDDEVRSRSRDLPPKRRGIRQVASNGRPPRLGERSDDHVKVSGLGRSQSWSVQVSSSDIP
jgi:hypothetical protein